MGVRRVIAAARSLVAASGPTPDPEGGIRRFGERFTVPEAEDAPVFLLAAGWRSASTALQRLVLSSDRCLVWGEPYAQLNEVHDLSRSFAAFALDWPHDAFLVDRVLPDGGAIPPDRWTANLYPSPTDLVESLRERFRRLYAVPARRRGYERWGLKEVRFGAPEIRLLHLLFPQARFVLLTRNPYDAWRSFRRHLPDVWHRRWPSDPVVTAGAFGGMWARLVDDFVSIQEDVGALFLRAEDLADPGTITALEDHLGLSLDAGVLERRVGSTSSPGLSAWGRLRLRAALGDRAARLGYHP